MTRASVQGGLIQHAIANGIDVYVVVATNGDGQEIAPTALGMGIPKTADFIAIGKQRQQESLSALKKLGVDPSHAFYLSYPDRGTKPMWMADWNNQCPYYSSYTKSTSSPYPLTYDHQATYCGWNLLKDLQEIIAAHKPDLIVIPHPDDQHPDHLAVSNFSRMAAALESQADPSYHPALLGYLVHYGYFPEPRGYHPLQQLLPPIPLSTAEYPWMRYDLTPQEELTKIAAINSYTSQIKMMRSFLVSFDRVNELYLKLELNPLPDQGSKSMPAPELTGGGANFYEPSRETSRLLVTPGADIVGLKVERQGDSLTFTVMAKGKLVEGVQYITYIKTPDGKTHKYEKTSQSEPAGATSFTTQVSLSELGNPTVLSFSGETRQDITLDNSAWEFVILSNSNLATSTPAP
jgi:LmbE family N-acetylglucosaminyl deacetylase